MNPEQPNLNRVAEKREQPRRAIDPDTGKPFPPAGKQWLQGKLTYIGIFLGFLGASAKLFGFDLPTDELNGMIRMAAEHYDTGLEFVGLATAAYGRLRTSKRNKAL